MSSLIHEVITEYAGRHPSKTAVMDIYGEISYGQLSSRSNAISRILTGLGVEAGDAVAVYVPYTKEILLGAFSALQSGGIFLPLDDAYPVERLNYMLEDSETKCLLTVRDLWEKKPLDHPEDRVVFMDEVDPEGDFDSSRAQNDEPLGTGGILAEDSPAMLLTEDAPAMLLYTSGTTGRPKGVLHEHRLLVNILDWMNALEDVYMDEDTRSGIMSGFTFIATQVFLFGPLTKGGTVCIAPEPSRKDMGYLHQFLREAKITHIFLPSGLGAVMAEDYDITGIKVFVAGEKLRNFRRHDPENRLINIYGSTEIGVVTAKEVIGDEERILIGQTAEGTLGRIVDDEYREVDDGDVGELLIYSPFMSLRYYRLPELSAEKWVRLDDKMWYRTGDRVRKLPGGDYDILGRMDNMVKLRGFRIETGEVEAQIANAVMTLDRGDVGNIVVVLRTVGGTDHLCCYYETKNELDTKAVSEEAAKHLAEYMVPDIWMRVDALPRNANGKVVRKDLPQPERNREALVIGAIDSEVLARLVYTAVDVLKPTVLVGPDDRFTDIGGDSITAMKYTALLREQGIRITSAQVLQLNTLRKIAEVAEVVYEQLWTPKEFAEIKADFASRGEEIQKVLPISTKQDELLFEQIIHPDFESLRDVLLLQVDSQLAEGDLRYALDVLAEENEELRSAIVFHHVTAIQQVITDRKIPLEIIELADFGGNEMARIRSSLMNSPMDLQKNSMIKVICVHTHRESFLCILTHCVAFEKPHMRRYVGRLMSLLAERYPQDISIRDWIEILEAVPSESSDAKATESVKKDVGIEKDVPPEICVYSENKGPKMVFVHTGNTGSSAYYRLAARIGNRVSFAVIEPFNLYHMDEACYGISAIAAKYIETLKRHQPQGPYILGGWCYGGVVAHEMACQLEKAGEEVKLLVLLDAHATANEHLRGISKAMSAEINREYFETCPLFKDLREAGMLEAMVQNAAHVTEDMGNHNPSMFNGKTLYFKPGKIPEGVSQESREYWEEMMRFQAGNYENFCMRDGLRVVRTPREHDRMMEDDSLDIIVPELMKAVEECCP